MPPSVVNQLNAELAKLLAEPGIRKRVLDFGMQPVIPGSPRQFGEFIRSEREKLGADDQGREHHAAMK